MIDVITEDVQRDMGDRFHDLAVRQSGMAGLFEPCLPEFPVLHHDAVREFQNGIRARVHCRSHPGIGEVLLAQSELAANERVGAEAIGTAIGLCDGERNLFAKFGGEASVRKGGAEAEVTLERSWRVAQDSKEIGDDAQLLVDALEERLGGSSGCLRIELCDASHDTSLNGVGYPRFKYAIDYPVQQ